jgi:hypothetical protein
MLLGEVRARAPPVLRRQPDGAPADHWDDAMLRRMRVGKWQQR